ncbi:MAG: hypothetical protein Q8M64_04345 [Methyloversatilis sp.]|nr:hypothetical protein [Methyloversatilis sp.]
MKLLKFLLWLVPLTLLLALAAVIGAVSLMVDANPALPEPPAVSPEAAEKLLQQLALNDPRRLRTGQRSEIRLDTADLQLLAHEAGRRLPATRLDLQPDAGGMNIAASTQVPAISRWVNVQARVAVSDTGQPALDTLRIGQLTVPDFIAQPLVGRAVPRVLEMAGVGIDPQRFIDLLDRVQISPAGIALNYVWSTELWKEGVQSMLPAGEAERLGFYHEALVKVVVGMRKDGDSELLRAMQALFALAEHRSSGGDAQAEQRSAVLALALFVNGRHPRDLVPQAAEWLPVPRLSLTLRGREDLSQHYVGSALLALHAGAGWADAIGLSKEVRDAQVGSGFSFTDLLADRAGTRLGEQIAAGRGNVSQRFAAGLPVDEVLPPIDGLPEFMPEEEFLRRFGGIGAPAYQAVIDDIEARLEKLELYR